MVCRASSQKREGVQQQPANMVMQRAAGAMAAGVASLTLLASGKYLWCMRVVKRSRYAYRW